MFPTSTRNGGRLLAFAEDVAIFILPTAVAAYATSKMDITEMPQTFIVWAYGFLFCLGVLLVIRRLFPVDDILDFYPDYASFQLQRKRASFESDVGLSVNRLFRFNRIMEFLLRHDEETICDFNPNEGVSQQEIMMDLPRRHHEELAARFRDELNRNCLVGKDLYQVIYAADSEEARQSVGQRLLTIQRDDCESHQSLFVIQSDLLLDLSPRSWNSDHLAPGTRVRPMGFTVCSRATVLTIPAGRSEGDTALFITGRMHQKFFREVFSTIFNHLKRDAICVVGHGKLTENNLGTSLLRDAEKAGRRRRPEDARRRRRKHRGKLGRFVSILPVLVVFAVAFSGNLGSLLVTWTSLPAYAVGLLASLGAVFAGTLRQGISRRQFLRQEGFERAIEQETENIAGMVFEGSGYLHAVKMLNPGEAGGTHVMADGEILACFNMKRSMLEGCSTEQTGGAEEMHHVALMKAIGLTQGYRQLFGIVEDDGFEEGLKMLLVSLKMWLERATTPGGVASSSEPSLSGYSLKKVSWRAFRFSWAFPNMFLTKMMNGGGGMLLSFTSDGRSLNQTLCFDRATAEGLIDAWYDYFNYVWVEAIPIVTEGQLDNESVGYLVSLCEGHLRKENEELVKAISALLL